MPHTSSGPLSDHQRRSAFAVAGALVLGAAIAIGALSSPGRPARRTTGTAQPASSSPPRIADAPTTTSTTQARTPPPHAVPSPGSQPTARDAQLIDRSARQFLAGYLTYEVGPLDTTARRELLAAATDALAHRLIDHPVDLPPGDRPAVGEVRSLVLSRSAGQAPIAVKATIEQAGWDSGLTLELEHAHGRWLVS